jgi:hypothetical protein
VVELIPSGGGASVLLTGGKYNSEFGEKDGF